MYDVNFMQLRYFVVAKRRGLQLFAVDPDVNAIKLAVWCPLRHSNGVLCPTLYMNTAPPASSVLGLVSFYDTTVHHSTPKIRIQRAYPHQAPTQCYVPLSQPGQPDQQAAAVVTLRGHCTSAYIRTRR